MPASRVLLMGVVNVTPDSFSDGGRYLAADAAIARRLAVRYLGLGLLGGAVGILAAVLTMALLGDIGGLVQLPAPAANAGSADWRFWAVLLGAAIATALVAMASAELVARRWLARLP